MIVSLVRHDWPEKAGFNIYRPYGYGQYTFLHFTTNIDFVIDGKTVRARPGACIFFTPDCPQEFFSSQDVIHNWMHSGSELGILLEKYGIEQNKILYPNYTDFISEIFRKIELEFFSSNPHKQELLDTYVKEFIIKFSRALKTENNSKIIHRKCREKLRAVRKEVLSHPEVKWTVEEMARLANLSSSRFHTVYKTLFGTSPMQDVIEAKIGYARSLLLSDEQLTLPVIAERLGYNDHYHFIRQFKGITGITPGVYRKKGESGK